MEGPQVAGLLITLMLIAAGVAVLLTAMVNRRKLLEMKHRERLAMIERGLVPSPEMDPNGFERRGFETRPPSTGSVRFRTAGVMLIGLGLGLMFLIGFAGNAPGVAIGLGGALALVGVAFVLNAMFSARDEALSPPSPAQSSAATDRAEPPAR